MFSVFEQNNLQVVPHFCPAVTTSTGRENNRLIIKIILMTFCKQLHLHFRFLPTGRVVFCLSGIL